MVTFQPINDINSLFQDIGQIASKSGLILYLEGY